ncbi:MAG: prolipoprotein diacylglyceryl transferase [Bacilli bacterium]|nr:prolipoprotein diacylglyceryl transferase [Bacilli bacterium]
MDRIAYDFGFFQVYWYSIFIFLALFFALIVIMNEVKKQNINQDFMVNLVFWGIIIGLFGARFYYVAFNLSFYLKYPLEIFAVWNGGMAIHGGIIFGLLWVLIYTKKYKVKTLKVLDITVVGLILGQAIGRWGNFFNKEAYGALVSRLDLEKLGLPDNIIEGMYINGGYRQPTFLYESIWNLIGFFLLLIIRKYKYLKTGQLTGFYLMWYSFGRFFIEGMRGDSLMFSTYKVAQIVSCILFVIGLLMVIFCKKGSRFEGLYLEAEKDGINF